MLCQCFVGDVDHPVFLLRDPKWVFVGVGEIHTRGRSFPDALLACVQSRVAWI